MSPFARLMERLRDPAVRDLAWALGSPGLLDPGHAPWAGKVLSDAFFSAALEEWEDWLTRLDAAPQPLHAFLEARHTHRLGRHFENLVAFWLAALGVADLRQNVPAMEGGRVLGEFDLLFGHPAWGGALHWELAVKFYLCHDPGAGLSGFLGPDPRDRLEEKLIRLFSHQLSLAETAAGRAALGHAAPLVARAVVKGWLFFPLGEAPYRVPGLSPHAPTGWWLRWRERALPQGHPSSRFKVLPRLTWLGPAVGREGERTLFDFQRLERVLDTHFSRSRTPVLVARLMPGEDGLWRETDRGFVVSADWPAVAPSV